MGIIQCCGCGKCCQSFGEIATRTTLYHKITLFEWARRKIIAYAKQKNLKVNIRPLHGMLHGNKAVIREWEMVINSKICHFFLEKTKHCEIHSFKPLICAKYPYPNDISDANWRCINDVFEKRYRKRVGKNSHSQKYISPVLNAAAGLLEFLEDIPWENDEINFNLISDSIKSNGIEFKNYYSELTRLQLIPTIFMETMEKIDFTRPLQLLTDSLELKKQLDENLVKKNYYDVIFDHWDESRSESMRFI
jgi:Fe-S-cluster containining protein